MDDKTLIKAYIVIWLVALVGTAGVLWKAIQVSNQIAEVGEIIGENGNQLARLNATPTDRNE